MGEDGGGEGDLQGRGELVKEFEAPVPGLLVGAGEFGWVGAGGAGEVSGVGGGGDILFEGARGSGPVVGCVFVEAHEFEQVLVDLAEECPGSGVFAAVEQVGSEQGEVDEVEGEAFYEFGAFAWGWAADQCLRVFGELAGAVEDDAVFKAWEPAVAFPASDDGDIACAHEVKFAADGVLEECGVVSEIIQEVGGEWADGI